MKHFLIIAVALVLSTDIYSQNKSDPYQLDYKDVHENMHYNQPLRPQVHYTPITGQIADPTGLVQYKGQYHMFYMFDLYSKRRGKNKGWGHAVSNDLIHWEQKPYVTNTVVDNAPGSGSGIVDWNNSLGLKSGPEKTMVVFYTDYGRGPSLMFSRDAGKTWIRHKENPILPGKGGFRDPVVFWYKPDQSWRMVIYDEPGLSFYKSDNLVDWDFLSALEDFYECPDIMHMPVDGDEDNKKWVLVDGNGSYVIGEFDGTHFHKESEKKHQNELFYLNEIRGDTNYYAKDIYATQSWKNTYEGEGPFIQMGFMMIKGAPNHDRTWSQQQSFPVELTLETVNGELQVLRNPIDAIKQLRSDPQFWNNETVKPGDNLLEDIRGDVFEIISKIDIGTSEKIVFDIRGEEAVYNVPEQELTFLEQTAKVTPTDNQIKLRFIIDRNSVEIYPNRGEQTFTRLFYPEEDNMKLGLTSEGGSFTVNEMELYKLESIWLKREQELGYQRD
ncbi:MAG: glycoside hydrolase family 32 protein [Balneolaceae bacterium]